MPINYDQVDALADIYYEGDTPEDKVFSLLVDIGDRYVSMLEEKASEHAAPYFAGSTPMEAAMRGLRENLDMKRDGTSPQYR